MPVSAGNLRELENGIERAVVLASGRQIEVSHLPFHLAEIEPIRITTEEGFLRGKQRVVAVFEREAVIRFLSEARGNISLAAKKAEITRRNFHRLLLKHSISHKKYKTEN